MTVWVKGNVHYYELDEYTPARRVWNPNADRAGRKHDDILSYLKDAQPYEEIQVFLDNAWCNVCVEHPPKTFDIKLSVQTYSSSWVEAAQHIDEILRKAGCDLKEDPIISYKISR